MKLSFGMIFSIILIIVFMIFSFYAIQKFLGMQKAIQIGQFVDGLKSNVDKMWNAPKGSDEFEYFLPKKIESVCFVDYSSPKKGVNQELYQELKQFYYEYENLFFYPGGSAEGLNAVEIEHIDIEKITAKENPFCIENIKGKVKMTLKKDYGEALVMVE